MLTRLYREVLPTSQGTRSTMTGWSMAERKAHPLCVQEAVPVDHPGLAGTLALSSDLAVSLFIKAGLSPSCHFPGRCA